MEIVSSPNVESSFKAAIIADFLCCPSLIKKCASIDTSNTPVSALSAVDLKENSPSIDAANAEKT